MVVLGARAASADVVARLEPGVAQPLSAPARDYFGVGFHAGTAAAVDVLPFLEVGGRVSYVFVSRSSASPLGGPASLLAVGALVRVHRPRETARWIPFAELALQYVRTGTLDRFGLAASAGVQFPLSALVAVGPWVGVQQVFRLGDTAAYPTRDATVFVGGLSIELTVVGPRRVAAPAAPPPAPALMELGDDADADGDGVPGARDRCPTLAEDRDGWQDQDGCPDTDDDADGVLDRDDACARVAGTAATHGCPDRDGDAIADSDDRCPDVSGVATEAGCPMYREVKVTASRVELARPVDFMRGSAAVPARAQAMLADAARALLDRGALCVQVLAHGDAGAKPGAALGLGTARAEAVRVVLMSRGVAPSRVSAMGAPGDGDVEIAFVPCEVNPP